jgi:hypothetical protein
MGPQYSCGCVLNRNLFFGVTASCLEWSSWYYHLGRWGAFRVTASGKLSKVTMLRINHAAKIANTVAACFARRGTPFDIAFASTGSSRLEASFPVGWSGKGKNPP